MSEVDEQRLLDIFKNPATHWSVADKKYIETLVRKGNRDLLKKMRATVYTK